LNEKHHFVKPGASILHFAPEGVIKGYLKNISSTYVSADLSGDGVDRCENIERMTLGDGAFEVVICSHVLEHVNDALALSEIYRVLTPGGAMVCMVPIIEGLDRTYEDPRLTSEEDREAHFGQRDHVRFYGRDFRSRVSAAGFKLVEYTAEGPDVVPYGLWRGEKLFVCTKP
jgi:predicted SAM-dependent methyltransferase